ncbi:MAG TPA: HAMP domain-containing sensor histidine kinase, partial [Verrucomicrobium sp.]|nr:HAMP domain-containing sensor histidine kinase [Verrucomicrobium sp.]
FRIVNEAKSPEGYLGYYEAGDLFFCVARLDGPGWYYLTTMPRSLLQNQAFRSAQWVVWAGLLSLALVLFFFAIILRRQISKPLAELDRATRQMSSGDTAARADIPGTDEFGIVAEVFNEMASRVATRDTDLRQLNEDLERRVAARTEELTEANLRLVEAGEETLRSLARERELGELRSRFVSLVSHEFRNPLHVILSSCDILQRYLTRLPEEDRAHHLQGIHDSVRHMGRMIEEVMVLGSAESGGMVFKPEPVKLSEFCERLVDGVRSATENRCPISLKYGNADLDVTADSNLLRHILGNVLTNAVKYSDAGSPIIFVVRVEYDQAEFLVEDQGRGIPPQDLERLYEPFRRGSNVGNIPGTGLGMVIVKRCVDLHGGTISCTSVVAVGTTFKISLPVAPVAPGTVG